MNQAQAIAKLSKTLGPTFAYRLDRNAPNAEQREEIRTSWGEANRIAKAAEAARVARKAELLSGDALYQELKTAALLASQAADKARRGLNSKRITVGRSSKLFFSVVADGDNWAEVVAKAIGSAA